MANPIKETPVLKGKDARIFLEKIQKSFDNRNTLGVQIFTIVDTETTGN